MRNSTKDVSIALTVATRRLMTETLLKVTLNQIFYYLNAYFDQLRIPIFSQYFLLLYKNDTGKSAYEINACGWGQENCSYTSSGSTITGSTVCRRAVFEILPFNTVTHSCFTSLHMRCCGGFFRFETGSSRTPGKKCFDIKTCPVEHIS